MVGRRIVRLPRFIAARAVDRGVLRGQNDYARFIVLGWYRTGSNLLLSLLNSDLSVAAYSELFSPKGLFWGNHVYAPGEQFSREIEQRFEAPSDFLRAAVFRGYPTGVRAVGFKLFYPQLVVRPIAGLQSALASMSDLRVIHLRRENLMRVLVSTEFARQTGQMASISAASAATAQSRVGTVNLPIERCETFFEQLTSRAAACAALFPAERLLDVSYEDLTAERDREMRRVREFLGLPERAASTRLVKQSSRSLRDSVSNFSELEAHFRGSEWERFFDE